MTCATCLNPPFSVSENALAAIFEERYNTRSGATRRRLLRSRVHQRRGARKGWRVHAKNAFREHERDADKDGTRENRRHFLVVLVVVSEFMNAQRASQWTTVDKTTTGYVHS